MGNNNEILEILDPVAPARVTRIKASTNMDTIKGKRVGLFWNRKPNGDLLLSRFGELLKNRYTDIKIEWLPGKNDPAQSAPQEVLNESSRNCDVIIVATGD